MAIGSYICVMEVNDVLVDKLAHLARLHFNEEEKQEIRQDLQKMIVFVEKLNELEFINGNIYANVYGSNFIVKIDTAFYPNYLLIINKRK